MGMTWRQGAWRGIRLIGVNLLVLVSLFLLLELGARWKDLALGESVRLGGGSFITPWITTRSHPPPWPAEGGGIFNHRAAPTPFEKPPGVTRLLAVGGSTTLNDYAYKTGKVDVPLLLEERLNRELGAQGGGARRYEVLNAGANAFSSAHTLVNLQFRLLEFHPDVVLILHNINDLDVNYYGDAGARSDYRNKYMRLYFLNDRIRLEDTLWSFLYQSRLLVKLGLGAVLAEL
ncbi:MAG: hypothetical protein HQL51_08050, partial [Magnetococcales bacterium]|nr:hypothetical protein [Magnetococcales bacterium]